MLMSPSKAGVSRRLVLAAPISSALGVPQRATAQDTVKHNPSMQAFSGSILDNTCRTMAALYQRTLERRQSASQFAAASAILHVFFDHLEETGVNGRTREWMLEKPEAFLRARANAMQIEAVRSVFAANGVTVGREDLEACLNPALPVRLRIQRMVEDIPLRVLEQRIVRGLAEAARWQPAWGDTQEGRPRLPLRNVLWCEIADWGSAYLGVVALAQTVPAVGTAIGATAIGIWAVSKLAC